MFDQLARNTWILLTLAIPGVTTYGTLRFALMLEPADPRYMSVLAEIDRSSALSICVITAIAVAQQSFAIVIESLLSLFSSLFRRWMPQSHRFFNERFRIAASGTLTPEGQRIVGNFFLSLNITVGFALLFGLIVVFRSIPLDTPVAILLEALLVAGFLATAYRLKIAKSVLN